MQYKRMPIEIESPEQMGYDRIRNNLSESSYTDAMLRDIGDLSPVLKDLVLCYGSHAGHEGLRELIVKDNALLIKEDVLLTMGAAAGLFIIATTLLEPGDEMVVIRPNYATNLETPRAIGARLHYIDLRFEEGFSLDLRAVEKAITARTKYISVTTPHNPTGVCLSHEELQTLTALAKAHHIHLLVDETYRDMVFGKPLPLAATYGDNVISISSLSKTYGLPGLRMGWIICRNQHLMETFLAAKEQIHICGSPLDEEVAFRYMQQRETHFQRITRDIREKFRIVKTWMEGQDDLEWVEPAGGCVCFPRMKRPEQKDVDGFHRLLLEKYSTYTGRGHWFEMPDHYMRIGFGWPAVDKLEEGLKSITECLRASGQK
ncbi:MAG: pyridoxal phosphate-dependent aminotransferase [Chitinophagaceae bacterium]|nr:pyridoxal phosphate-dependent aminotransferase [Chitinophagaceae bacterium]